MILKPFFRAMAQKEEGDEDVWTVSATGKTCSVTLPSGTVLGEIDDVYHAELDALCHDLRKMWSSTVFYALVYDPGSFSKDFGQWLESVLEPSVNCQSKLIAIETDEEGQIVIAKQSTSSST
jgi:hypothetical protein